MEQATADLTVIAASQCMVNFMTIELSAPLSEILNRDVAREAQLQKLNSYCRIDLGLASPHKRKTMLFAVELKESASHQLWINTSPLARDATFGGDIFYSDVNGERCACLASFAESKVSSPDSESGSHISSRELVSVQFEEDPVIEGLIQLALLALEKSENLSPMFAIHLAGVLHAHLVERYEFSPGKMVVPGGLARWQERRAKDLLSANLAREVKLESVAEACGMAIGTFSKAFTATVGTPPYRWLTRRRIYFSCDLLRDHPNMTIAEVAYRSGISDLRHFSQLFKKHIGMSPNRWRLTCDGGLKKKPTPSEYVLMREPSAE